ncbi:hypothetical protein [Streptomyces sp. C1-2]|uniref:DUF7426 family protein n=1 Tax=Streptomyces sp. C1-2 TaxID=2720022 RepID=UPI00143271D6|nr:hypothetical protein [Streptomyces sp. C1-2]NJP70046.1 hypothetical protein [Streptomyces sp. C1-2]
MAATFEALGDFLDDWLELPIRMPDGQTRVWRIPSPPASTGLRVEQLTKAAAKLYLGGAAPDTEVLSDAEEKDLFKLLLGPLYPELAEALPWTRFRHVALTTLVWILNDRDTAAQFWSSGGDPSLLAPNRAARRQQRSQPSASAAANTTRSRGSTSGTKAGSPRRRKRGSGASR